MPDYPLSAPRLHALLGDAMRELPAHFVIKLEAMLVALQSSDATPRRPAHLFVVSGGTPSPQTDAQVRPPQQSNALPPSAPAVAAGWLRAAGTADNWCTARLQGLAAVLELLHAVHLEKDGDGGEPMLGEHLVEGLLVAGRLLAGYPDGGAADDAHTARQEGAPSPRPSL